MDLVNFKEFTTEIKADGNKATAVIEGKEPISPQDAVLALCLLCVEISAKQKIPLDEIMALAKSQFLKQPSAGTEGPVGPSN